MRAFRIQIFLFCTVIATQLLNGDVFAQYELTSKNKKACKAYTKATEYYQNNDLAFALIELEKATDTDPGFIEAWMLKGDIKEDQSFYEEAIFCYNKAIEINPDFFTRNFYNVARLEVRTGKYEDAKSHYESYLAYPGPNANLLPVIYEDIATCIFAIEAVKHPVPFDPVNMGDSINTIYNEYSPTLTVDENTFIITRERPRDEATVHHMQYEEDFFVSYKIDSSWSYARKLPPPVNSHGNEGAQCISPDGSIMYFTICNKPEGFGSCDLYYSVKEGNKWSKPANMGALVNSTAWDSQPTISPDGKTIYFASARDGGKGNMDIWKTTFVDGKWTKAVNLGDSINTTKGDFSPFIHTDGVTLYFTSYGHVGMGGADIFYSRLDDAGEPRKPVNLGYPINTFKDEGFLIVNAKGDKAYFASNNYGGKGGLDLYTFELYEEARPLSVTYMKGKVFDSKTGKKLKAHFELIDLQSGKTIVESYSDPVTGEFLVSLPTEHNYALNVSKDGYLYWSGNIILTGKYSKSEPFNQDVPLQPMEVGETVVLKNIFFDFDKFELLDESRIELDKWVELFVKNPSMKIEIGGHTDNKGGKDYNQKLSENRAKAVYDYLAANGIDKNRLSYKGYGMDIPIDTNDTEEGRANNRRTEFKVIDF